MEDDTGTNGTSTGGDTHVMELVDDSPPGCSVDQWFDTPTHDGVASGQGVPGHPPNGMIAGTPTPGPAMWDTTGSTPPVPAAPMAPTAPGPPTTTSTPGLMPTPPPPATWTAPTEATSAGQSALQSDDWHTLLPHCPTSDAENSGLHNPLPDTTENGRDMGASRPAVELPAPSTTHPTSDIGERLSVVQTVADGGTGRPGVLLPQLLRALRARYNQYNARHDPDRDGAATAAAEHGTTGSDEVGEDMPAIGTARDCHPDAAATGPAHIAVAPAPSQRPLPLPQPYNIVDSPVTPSLRPDDRTVGVSDATIADHNALVDDETSVTGVVALASDLGRGGAPAASGPGLDGCNDRNGAHNNVDACPLGHGTSVNTNGQHGESASAARHADQVVADADRVAQAPLPLPLSITLNIEDNAAAKATSDVDCIVGGPTDGCANLGPGSIVDDQQTTASAPDDELLPRGDDTNCRVDLRNETSLQCNGYQLSAAADTSNVANGTATVLLRARCPSDTDTLTSPSLVNGPSVSAWNLHTAVQTATDAATAVDETTSLALPRNGSDAPTVAAPHSGPDDTASSHPGDSNPGNVAPAPPPGRGQAPAAAAEASDGHNRDDGTSSDRAPASPADAVALPDQVLAPLNPDPTQPSAVDSHLVDVVAAVDTAAAAISCTLELTTGPPSSVITTADEATTGPPLDPSAGEAVTAASGDQSLPALPDATTTTAPHHSAIASDVVPATSVASDASPTTMARRLRRDRWPTAPIAATSAEYVRLREITAPFQVRWGKDDRHPVRAVTVMGTSPQVIYAATYAAARQVHVALRRAAAAAFIQRTRSTTLQLILHPPVGVTARKRSNGDGIAAAQEDTAARFLVDLDHRAPCSEGPCAGPAFRVHSPSTLHELHSAVRACISRYTSAEFSSTILTRAFQSAYESAGDFWTGGVHIFTELYLTAYDAVTLTDAMAADVEFQTQTMGLLGIKPERYAATWPRLFDKGPSSRANGVYMLFASKPGRGPYVPVETRDATGNIVRTDADADLITSSPNLTVQRLVQLMARFDPAKRLVDIPSPQRPPLAQLDQRRGGSSTSLDAANTAPRHGEAIRADDVTSPLAAGSKRVALAGDDTTTNGLGATSTAATCGAALVHAATLPPASAASPIPAMEERQAPAPCPPITVATLAGVPAVADEAGDDAGYAGTQPTHSPVRGRSNCSRCPRHLPCSIRSAAVDRTSSGP